MAKSAIQSVGIQDTGPFYSSLVDLFTRMELVNALADHECICGEHPATDPCIPCQARDALARIRRGESWRKVLGGSHG